MNLTSRQQHALVSICDTFLPAAEDWPSASELNIPSAIASALDFNPRSDDRAQFLQLLDLWDSQLPSLGQCSLKNFMQQILFLRAQLLALRRQVKHVNRLLSFRIDQRNLDVAPLPRQC